MPDLLLLSADLVAITVLTYLSYFRKHRRRDMLLAYMGLNVGVLAVSTVLTGSAVGLGLGLGLGLFGVLSIIRLRSSEISQEEVAYYFASLALGLIFGLAPDPRWLAVVLGALIVGVVLVVDHAPIHARARRQIVVLDTVITDENELAAHLGRLLGATVTVAVVQSTDLVRDSMVVDVRYRLPAEVRPVQAWPGDDGATGLPRTVRPAQQVGGPVPTHQPTARQPSGQVHAGTVR